MGWYAQTNYSDLQGINGKYKISEIGCFLTAFCNLLRRFSKDVSPPDLNRIFIQRGIFIDVDDGVRDDLGWQSITAYDGQIHVTGTGTGWPKTNNAILKFRYRSVQHPNLPNGQPNIINHFCLVADEAAGTFIDSWDGVVKKVTDTVYGEPVEYATYENVVPQPVQPVPAPAAPVAASDNSGDKVYNLGKGETITLVAQRFGYSAQELLDHNGLSWAQARELPVGYPVRLPYGQSQAPAPAGIRYEVLPEPTAMHISNSAGAKKWSFGNVKNWADFKESGFAPFEANFTAVAIAWVPVPDANDQAAYYMDANALGDYVTTGRVAYTVGFSHADVDKGAVAAATPAAPTPADPEIVEVTVQDGWGVTQVLKAAGYPADSFVRPEEWQRLATLNGSDQLLRFKPGQVIKVYRTPMPLPEPEPAPAPVNVTPDKPAPTAATPAPAPGPDSLADKLANGTATSADTTNPNVFKGTFKAFAAGTQYYIAKQSVMVRDYGGVRPPHRLTVGNGYEVDGTFEVDGKTILRFASPAKNGFWFGVPETDDKGAVVLQHEDELFTIPSKQPSATAAGANAFVKLFDVVTKTIIPKLKAAWAKK